MGIYTGDVTNIRIRIANIPRFQSIHIRIRKKSANVLRILFCYKLVSFKEKNIKKFWEN